MKQANFSASIDRMTTRDEQLSIDVFKKHVYLQYDEGATLFLTWACVEEDPKDPSYLWIFSEHRQPICVPRDDVDVLLELTPSKYWKNAERDR